MSRARESDRKEEYQAFYKKASRFYVCLGSEYVTLPIFRVCVVLSRGFVRGLVAAIGRCWPYDEWQEGPSISTDALNSSNHSTLDTRTNTTLPIVLAN